MFGSGDKSSKGYGHLDVRTIRCRFRSNFGCCNAHSLKLRAKWLTISGDLQEEGGKRSLNDLSSSLRYVSGCSLHLGKGSQKTRGTDQGVAGIGMLRFLLQLLDLLQDFSASRKSCSRIGGSGALLHLLSSS